jgi:hypothetical protein
VALLTSGPALGQTFNQRMAQYQRPPRPATASAPARRSAPRYAAEPAAAEGEVVEEAMMQVPAGAPDGLPAPGYQGQGYQGQGYQGQGYPPPGNPAPGSSLPGNQAAAGPGAGGQRVLSNAYSPPLHTPNYNAPMSPACASCGHNPGFIPPGDTYGTCMYGDGYGGGACGPGCGPCGGPGFFGPGGLFGVANNCNGSCGGGGCGDGCCDGGGCSNPLVWARFEVLLWWRQGQSVPPLVTSDPTTEAATTAGILPDAAILFGNGRIGSGIQGGGRIDVGTWLNPTQSVGIGDRVFGIGKDARTFNAISANTPVLAIPFVNFTSGANDALLIAYPGLRSGAINVALNSSLISNDVYARFLLCRDWCHRLDFITGWNYTRVNEDAALRTTSTVTEVGGTIPTGTVRNTLDQWSAANDFNGAIFGLQWQRNCGCWTTTAMARMSIGNMHETMVINGSSTTRVPGQGATTAAGGALTAPSSIGQSSRNEFTAITEVGLNLGYRFAPCTQFLFGYSFLYINDIASAGSAIDTSIGTNAGVTRPQFGFRHSDFWAQGINLGVQQDF